MDFEHTTAAFLQWFKSASGSEFHESLQIVDLRSRQAGRGIVATSDIPADTVLFQIPRSRILDIRTSRLFQVLPQLLLAHKGDESIEDADGKLQDLPAHWLNLILVLLYESFHYEDSPWKPYLDILPSTTSDFSTLMFWSDEELVELQASHIRSKIGKDSASRMFRERIIPMVDSHAESFYPAGQVRLEEHQLLERCHIIGSLIMSYAFDLQSDEDEDDDEDEGEDGWIEDRSTPAMLGMVPMADMLNADAEFNAHLSHGDLALTMISLREIKAGEEVLNYYGPLPNSELLRRYGYTTPKHSRYDVVELDFNLVKQTLVQNIYTDNNASPDMIKAVDKWADDEGMSEDDSFVLEREPGDPDDQGRLPEWPPKFLGWPDDLADLVGTLAVEFYNVQSKKRKPGDAEKTSIDVISHDLLEQIITRRRAQYTTTFEEDSALLANSTQNSRLSMAIHVRLGEKTVLEHALNWAREKKQKYQAKLASVQEAALNQNGNNKKKQKR